MYLHFEGLDLAGKSTVCRRWCAQAIGPWELRRNTLLAGNSVYELADRMRREGGSAETLGWLYYAALLHDLDGFTPPAGDTVQDSTILLRSLAFHRVRGTPGLVDRLEAVLERHPRFDRTFVCVASHEVRLRRLDIRKPQNLGPEDFLVRDDPQTFFAMERVLIDYATRHFQAAVIDTSGLEAQPRLEVVFRHLPDRERDQPPPSA